MSHHELKEQVDLPGAWTVLGVSIGSFPFFFAYFFLLLYANTLISEAQQEARLVLQCLMLRHQISLEALAESLAELRVFWDQGRQ